jgi:hypothetical protein
VVTTDGEQVAIVTAFVRNAALSSEFESPATLRHGTG